MKPLILISNDDGYQAPGIRNLARIACEFGEVVVVAPHINASAKSHSLTVGNPLRAEQIPNDGYTVYAVTGTPADCVKLGVEHLCPRRPDLVLSGINHGSNASINILYSGTMGAALEATTCGYPSIGFSLLSHNENAMWSPAEPYIKQVIEYVLSKGLPDNISLNVNIPILEKIPKLKGMRVCRSSAARWTDSFEKRVDPYGRDYYWLTGKFVCEDMSEDTDQWALANGYISIVPCRPDFTDFSAVQQLQSLNTK